MTSGCLDLMAYVHVCCACAGWCLDLTALTHRGQQDWGAGVGSGSFPSPQGLPLASVILISVAGAICPHLYHSATLGQCLV